MVDSLKVGRKRSGGQSGQMSPHLGSQSELKLRKSKSMRTPVRMPRTLTEPVYLDNTNKAVLVKAADGQDPSIKLNQFRLTHQLGAGSHNVVYLARHPANDSSWFAIKAI